MDSRISSRALSAALAGWRTREPAYEALADGIRLLCLDNRLPPRTALPAERDLAATLRLSRSTVAAAYRSLRDSGHIESLRGSGSVTVPMGRPGSGVVQPTADAIDLQQASPAAWPGLTGVMAEVAGDAAALTARSGYDTVGHARLRAAIAQSYTERGVATTPEQILVTAGAQSAIALLAATLLRRGDRALFETPTYPHAADAVRAAGARLVGVPVSVDEGWDLDRAEQALARTRPVIAYLMPTFHNPTGRSMGAQEQTRLGDAATRSGTVVVVDETTADLAIDGPRRRPAFADHAVVRVGSFGKTVWGGLRVGWVRADVDLIRRLSAARPRRDLGTPELEQAIATRIVPLMDQVLSQRAHLLRTGREALTAALRTRLPAWTPPAVRGGLSLWVALDAPLSSAVVLAARSRGLYLTAGPRFGIDGGHEGRLRLPFTAPPDDLRRAVDILAEVWPDVVAGVPEPGAPFVDALV
jgi:DNA-binding transcriptional MocR family regulator